MKKVVVQVKILGDGVLTPEDLPLLLKKVAEAVEDGGKEVVVVSGRLPVWAYCTLIHLFHPRPAVATYEPRLGKGVCVSTHIPELKVGDLVETEGAKLIEVEYIPLHMR